MSAKQFEIKLGRAFADKMAEVDGFVKFLFLEALRGVVLVSPVDTGRFRGNWGMTFIQPGNETYETLTPEASISRVTQAVQSYPKGKFEVAYLQNNLPYADKLEEGSSKQARRGIISITVVNLTARYHSVTI